MPVDKFGRMSDAKTRDTGVSLTYINNNYIRRDGSTPVSGSIDMKGNTLYNVANPVNLQDVATKEYSDQVGGGSPFFKEKGNYQAMHTINMGFKKLLNLRAPSDPFDAATKDYEDYVKSILNESLIGLNELYISIYRTQEEIKEKFKKRPHIIAVHASYSGPLRKNEFQFSFGGNEANNSTTGFLLPHSGRIKKKKKNKNENPN